MSCWAEKKPLHYLDGTNGEPLDTITPGNVSSLVSSVYYSSVSHFVFALLLLLLLIFRSCLAFFFLRSRRFQLMKRCEKRRR